MKSTRRNFFKTATMGALGSSFLFNSCTPADANENGITYDQLDEILSRPVLKKNLFPDPVIIDHVSLLQYGNSMLCRVVSRDGAEGICVSNSTQLVHLYPIFVNRIQPFFIGKDATQLDQLLKEVYVYQSNYKLQSLALWVPVATMEMAILDMLGQIAEKPMGELIGDIHNTHVAIYQANNNRGRSAEESLARIEQRVEETRVKALKFKVAGRMYDSDDPPGRSEKLIPLVGKRFGDDFAIYADANGGYSVDEAIRIGKLMEEYNFDYFEEPVPFDHYLETKQVADALQMFVAGGEQEPAMWNFRWMVKNDALQVFQPDQFYFGGLIPSIKVARMAEAVGKLCQPHISGAGLGYLYMMHFVSALSNAAPYHEFKGFNDNLPMECPTSSLTVDDNGAIKVPTGPGLGVNIDPDFFKKHKVVTT